LFSVNIETGFKASHQLRLQNGKKEPLHDHDWKVLVCVRSENLDDMGLVIDFHKLKKMSEKTLSTFENKCLNNLDYFEKTNPSAENIAKYIYENIQNQLPDNIELYSVSVTEEPGCSTKFVK